MFSITSFAHAVFSSSVFLGLAIAAPHASRSNAIHSRADWSGSGEILAVGDGAIIGCLTKDGEYINISQQSQCATFKASNNNGNIHLSIASTSNACAMAGTVFSCGPQVQAGAFTADDDLLANPDTTYHDYWFLRGATQGAATTPVHSDDVSDFALAGLKWQPN